MQKIKYVVLFFCMSVFITAFSNSIVLQTQYSALRTHFHATKCIAQSISFLYRLAENNYHYQPCTCTNVYDCILVDSTLFSHPIIKKCIQKMEHTQSLNPILFLFSAIKHKYFYDNQFIHELFLLIFTVQKEIILQECQEHSHKLKRTTLETVLQVSEKINQLPIAGVLSAIDMLITEIPPILEKYEVYSTMTWKDWLKKYWWAPPIFGGWFALKILFYLQRQSFYYSSPLYTPRPQVSLSPITTHDPALLEIRQQEN